MEPCFFCGKSASVTFNHADLFDRWVVANYVIAPSRSCFNGMRERLEWAAKDETKTGAHATCALRWAVKEEGYSERYAKVDVLVEAESLRDSQ